MTEANTQLRNGRIPASIIDELERSYWPMRLRGQIFQLFLVPIRPAFAMELFDRQLSRDTMLFRIPRAAPLPKSRGALKRLRVCFGT